MLGRRRLAGGRSGRGALGAARKTVDLGAVVAAAAVFIGAGHGR